MATKEMQKAEIMRGILPARKKWSLSGAILVSRRSPRLIRGIKNTTISRKILGSNYGPRPGLIHFREEKAEMRGGKKIS